jgi:phage protein D
MIMVGTSLTTNEKQICPKLFLKHYPQELNEFVKNTHKELRRRKTEEKNKPIKINKKFKKEFNKLLRSEEKKKEIANATTKLATTKDLSRILSLIQLEKKIGLSDLTQTTKLKPNVFKNGLHFLLKYDLIKQSRGNNGELIIKIK